MLITIAIMLMLVTAAVTIMPSLAESRRTREAARMVNIYLSTARNRAMESGRPCGVTFHLLAGTRCVLTADQCEVPPCYEGQTEQSMARVDTAAGTVHFVDATGGDEVLPANMVRLGDLIQFNRQGVIYSISGLADANGFLNGSSFSIAAYDPSPAPSLPSYAQPVPFRIFRSPVKSGAEPLQLPAGAVVDVPWSGTGSAYIDPQWNSGTRYTMGQTVGYNGQIYVAIYDVSGVTPSANGRSWRQLTSLTVQFSSTGAADRLYFNSTYVRPTDQIYLLIGKRERMANPFVGGNTNESTLTNWQDLKNLWVTVNPHTGLINTEPVASGGDVAAARALATQGIGMGGK